MVGPSPFTYTALTDGALFVSGGGVAGMQMQRGSAVFPIGVPYGAFPMKAGDEVHIQYVRAPAVMFFP
jgi:hypothetical protein